MQLNWQERERGRKAREVSLCAGVDVGGRMWGGAPGLPPPQPAPLTPSPTPGPSQGQDIRQVDRQAKPLGLFKPPRASNKSNILRNQVQPFLLTSQTFAYNPL